MSVKIAINLTMIESFIIILKGRLVGERNKPSFLHPHYYISSISFH